MYIDRHMFWTAALGALLLLLLLLPPVLWRYLEAGTHGQVHRALLKVHVCAFDAHEHGARARVEVVPQLSVAVTGCDTCAGTTCLHVRTRQVCIPDVETWSADNDT